MAKESTSKVYAKIHAPKGLKGENRREDFNPPIKMTLHEMQEFVGDTCQWVRSTEAHRLLVVDDNGLYTKKPDNLIATDLVPPEYLLAAPIRGNALLVGGR